MNNKTRRQFMTSAVSIGTLIPLAGCSGNGDKKSARVEIVDYDVRTTEGGYIEVWGEVKNLTEKILPLVEVEARFYDSEDVRVATAVDMVNDLRPGKTWEFSAMCFDCPDWQYISYAKVSAVSSGA